MYRGSVPCIAVEAITQIPSFFPLAIKSVCLPVHLPLWHVGLLIPFCGGLWAQRYFANCCVTKILKAETVFYSESTGRVN